MNLRRRVVDSNNLGIAVKHKVTMISVFLCASLAVGCSPDDQDSGGAGGAAGVMMGGIGGLMTAAAGSGGSYTGGTNTGGTAGSGFGGQAGAVRMGGAPTVSLPSSFDTYCTGIVKNDTEYQLATGPGAWSGEGQKVPGGTKFLLERSFSNNYGGIVFVDNQPALLHGDFFKGLVKDKDFTSNCTNEKAATVFIILVPSTIFPDMTFTSTSCSVKQGTAMVNHSFDVSKGKLSSRTLKEICGFETGYSKDLVYSRLFRL